ncbi:MAG: hypothetical protein DYG94_14745 [Leptolyngbya sp. PLA3]|nr:MAG: hypothetical protein EDM82_15155 [Cyanobacteria bacterium CYA]MCE7969988.1 hypothetical protein [Leptolyngbya sp. PL-A3]
MIAQWSNAFAAAVFCAAAATCGAQTYFDLWFEAPESVSAGDTFTVEVWAGASGLFVNDGLNISLFHSLLMSVEVSGDLDSLASISPATIHTNFALNTGAPTENWLVDVMAFNLLDFGFDPDNPMHLFSFDVSTTTMGRGTLTFNAHPSSTGPDMLWWFVQPPTGDSFYIGSADDASVLTANPFAVRVIPAPAGVAILALGGVASLRRRRSFQSGSLRAISR